MKNLVTPFLAVILITTAISSSCTKTVIETKTVTIRDTLTIKNTDTLEVLALDTVIAMNAKNWSGFSYETDKKVDSGTSTFYTTSEGIRFVAQEYRLGIRIQTRSEFGFRGKNVYMKWKAYNNNQFAAIVPQLKYDPTSADAVPFIQGLDLAYYSLQSTWQGSILLQPNIWYYTRWVPVAGTDDYTIITSVGNYDNSGGTIVANRTTPIYTKSGYIGLRIGDPFGGTGAYAVLAECRVSGK
jgi:hypothetical protein